MNSTLNPSMSNDKKLHIVMFPWLAFGHMIPFLELSKLVAQKGHKITFLSTPKNIDRLPKLPPHLSPLIALTKIPLPHVDKLPSDAEATIDLPYDQVKYLKKAYDELQQPITQLLQDKRPDWVIYDFVPFWLGSIAGKLGISTVFFSIFIAATGCFLGPVPILKGLCDEDRTKPEDFTVPPKWIPFETSIAFRVFEIKRVIDDVVRVDDENIPGNYRRDPPETSNSSGSAPPPRRSTEAAARNGGELKSGSTGSRRGRWCTWRSGASHGRVNFEVTELAHGLERSELPFFWVLRKVAGCEAIELPDGFEERTKGIGVVCSSWAPQLRILSHDSVGGFLTHSGWSSVVEGVQFGKALILLTFLADTGLIARLLEEKKMGYSIPRDELDGSFTCDSVAESLRLVMVEEGGKMYRDGVKEMRGCLVTGICKTNTWITFWITL
ncbi:UDP-Glycosyltransferase superfamily protein [Actinidia rufa]|uniref:UDP-Glycosyltransferase superfamily protein n=1 Tax=Actinidia rufa TaxID=165716 RepID=A0A7J0DQ71_9ERIC|nr:UDP-Glycosyltransferase superfamily protein [Actinidia rufa]